LCFSETSSLRASRATPDEASGATVASGATGASRATMPLWIVLLSGEGDLRSGSPSESKDPYCAAFSFFAAI
jgi:hypothetical protein